MEPEWFSAEILGIRMGRQESQRNRMVDHIHSSLGKNVITQYQEKVRLTRNNEEATRGERDTI